MFKGEDFLIFFGEILEMIPFAGFEVFKPLVVFILLPEDIFYCVFNFVLKLEFIFFSHLYFDPLGFLFVFVS